MGEVKAALLNFDYIAGEALRASLESDYAELKRSQEQGNWKCVLVLAGSIIEALLVDTLQALSQPGGKDPLKLDLSEAIAACKTSGVISERAADLCSVVRSYRNLIHPGRVVRLSEPLPTASTAAVAMALVEMTAEEVAKKRRTAVGLTAEQVLSKIVRDVNVGVILRHLLDEVPDQQKRRLLLDLLPQEYERANQDFSGDEDRISDAFRVVFDSADSSVKAAAAQSAVRVIREGDGDFVERYLRAFFQLTDIEFVAEKDRPIIVAKILGMPQKQSINQLLLKVWRGLGKYISVDQVSPWVDAYIRTIVFGKDSIPKAVAREQFISEASDLSGQRESRLVFRLDAWKSSYKDNEEAFEEISALSGEIDDFRGIPF